jgi:hypothetical protein
MQEQQAGGSSMSSEHSIRHWVALRLCLGLDFRLEAHLSPTPDSIVLKNESTIAQWVKKDGPRCLFAGLAPLNRPVGGHSFQVVLGLSPPRECEGKVMYFMRTVSCELSTVILSGDSSVLCGEMPSNAVEVVHDQMQNVMAPMIQVSCKNQQTVCVGFDTLVGTRR